MDSLEQFGLNVLLCMFPNKTRMFCGLMVPMGHLFRIYAWAYEREVMAISIYGRSIKCKCNSVT